jgi:hypothetical protein
MVSNVHLTFIVAPKLLKYVRHEAKQNRRWVGAEITVLLETAQAAREPKTDVGKGERHGGTAQLAG